MAAARVPAAMAATEVLAVKQKIDSHYSKASREIRAECCICLSTTKRPYIKSIRKVGCKYGREKKMCSISEIDPPFPIADNTIFKGPCNKEKHAICKECLRTIAISKQEINHKSANIRCVYPFEDCVKSTSGNPSSTITEIAPGVYSFSFSTIPDPDEQPFGTINTHRIEDNVSAGIADADSNVGVYFDHVDIKKVLTANEYKQYQAHADKYRFPGFEIIKCPLNIYNHRSGVMYKCNAENIVSLELIKTTPKGALVITCDQNMQCLKRFCFHCFRKIPPHYGDTCIHCTTGCENKDPLMINRYFYKSGDFGENPRGFYKNGELTKEIVMEQLMETIAADKVSVKCFECGVLLVKSEKCNGLSHCGVEHCYACGRSGTRTDTLTDHWSEIGVSGCPRWDFSECYAHCNYECQEDVCFSHETGDCTRAEHQSGIKALAYERKKAHVYHALKSLLPALRAEIMPELVASLPLSPRSGEGQSPSSEPAHRSIKLCNVLSYNDLPSGELCEILDTTDRFEILTTYSETLLRKHYPQLFESTLDDID